MSWFEWYPTVLRRYAVFDGRAGRPEFWWFQLANLIVVIVVSIISSAVGASRVLVDLYQLAVLLPSLGVSIRRLHDTNRSGWWILIGLIPIVGWILFIVWAASAGTPGPNRFGDGPRDQSGAVPSAGFSDPGSVAPYQPPAEAQSDPQSGGTSSRYCARCGSALAPGATFCGNCGAPVA
jgi:uncharacterized membrane protein YhaH (DUF805 family)